MLVTVRRASRARNTHTHSKVVQHAPSHWPGAGPTPGLTHPQPCPGVHVMTHGRCGAARRRRGGGAHWDWVTSTRRPKWARRGCTCLNCASRFVSLYGCHGQSWRKISGQKTRFPASLCMSVRGEYIAFTQEGIGIGSRSRPCRSFPLVPIPVATCPRDLAPPAGPVGLKPWGRLCALTANPKGDRWAVRIFMS